MTYVENEESLAKSVQAFMEEPWNWGAAVGKNPKYFVHLESGKHTLFGLSKFCALSGISLHEYIIKFRRLARGGTNQQLISKISKKQWIPLGQCDPVLQRKFTEWFQGFVGHRKALTNISILTLDAGSHVPTGHKRKRTMSPKELGKRLERQIEIGEIGEEAAFKYEVQRLGSLGVESPGECVDHVSKRDVAAGFDLHSFDGTGHRYIEVKSTSGTRDDFYISENEMLTLKQLSKEAFIYFVQVNMKTKRGKVVREVVDPFSAGDRQFQLLPVLYRATGLKAVRGGFEDVTKELIVIEG